jgi:D-amino-acid dehydrogenase
MEGPGAFINLAENEPEVLVIGGGVIGVCAAYYAAKSGSRVTWVERSAICSGCSRGNAGWLVPSHCIPLASPGALSKGLKWMWSGSSSFSIRPRLDWGLLQWLIAFAGACNEQRVRESIPVLRDLTFRSLALYHELCGVDGVKCGLRSSGSLMLFATNRGFEEGRRDAELLGESGIASEIWSVEEILHKESSIRPEIAGGVLYPEDAQILPSEFVESLATVVQQMGAAVLPSTQVTGFQLEHGIISRVQTTRGEFRPGAVILAAGADSAPIARKLGMRLPIEAGKGYSFSIPSTIFNPSRCLLLSEAKVAVTPFGDRVRFGGTFELSGLDLTINTARLTAIRDSASLYVSAMLPANLDEQWSGLRPCTPDGLPVISLIPSVRNLVVASGHAMLGVSLGPVSGKLAAQLARDERPDIEISALRFSRF